MTEFVSSAKAQEFYKVSEQTLRDWANENKVNFITTNGGHRRYRVILPTDNKRKIIYARVSSKKQENRLTNSQSNPTLHFLKGYTSKSSCARTATRGFTFERLRICSSGSQTWEA